MLQNWWVHLCQPLHTSAIQTYSFCTELNETVLQVCLMMALCSVFTPRNLIPKQHGVIENVIKQLKNLHSSRNVAAIWAYVTRKNCKKLQDFRGPSEFWDTCGTVSQGVTMFGKKGTFNSLVSKDWFNHTGRSGTVRMCQMQLDH